MNLCFCLPFALTLPAVAAYAQSSALNLIPQATQEVKQPIGTSLNVSVMDGEINEGLMQGGTVVERGPTRRQRVQLLLLQAAFSRPPERGV
jgi:hypothetical protein